MTDDIGSAAGAVDVIEADTAESAIAAVHDRWGPDARIVGARRELRGGIGGFFAKEVVQLHVAPGDHAVPARRHEGPDSHTTQPAAPPTNRDGEVEASPVDRLLADATDVDDFASFLRRRMAEDGSPAPTSPTPSTSPTDDTAPQVRTAPSASASDAFEAGVAGPAWSHDVLLQLGLPVGFVRGIELTERDDDLAWTTALASALVATCGPLPAGPALLVGPNADALSRATEEPAARSRIWFDALREGRWLHLVVGGEGWRDQLAAGPRAVSWVQAEHLPDALRCAVELGLTLGYGPLGGGVRRARPVDVAMAIRALVDAR